MNIRKKITVPLFLFTICVNAQFKYKGVGVFGSLTQSAHSYNNTETDKKDTTYVYKHFYPQTHISKEFFNWGAGAFVEFGKENLRWQTELEYINKGAKEMELTNPYTGERSGSYSTTKLTYIEWNNYLKFYNPAGFAHWYWMPGIRLEYLFKKSAGAYSDVVNDFPKFWFSGDVAVGYEFPLFKKFSAFAEYHWNPDIIPFTYNSNTKIRKRTFELRVGMTMRPRKRRIDDCNAPVYKGPAH
ncbi:MAG: hypothetical protein IT236_13060 [Bacteroidia bacterium]|nr:hypothetical protein [Bacteroidia bacterium]